ncbi:MAG: VWA domain-containing protein, partial [Deltaproteobacteria bacterium]|nr:VWA domain-containing protein [Deltaproteobacteria bacterium]
MMRAISRTCCVVVLLSGPSPMGHAAAPEVIDIVFALDTTGSMSDEIRLVRRLVWDMANGVVLAKPAPSLRLALVRYRDKGDSYVVKVTPLTRDLDAIHKVLMRTSAGGGGDWPEHVSLALHHAVKQKWRPTARKMIFLIGDAPPSKRGEFHWRVEAQRAKKAGVAIHAIGCTGIRGGAEIFRKIAKLSGGTYTPLPRGAGGDMSFRNTIFAQAALRHGGAKSVVMPKPALKRDPTPSQ